VYFGVWPESRVARCFCWAKLNQRMPLLTPPPNLEMNANIKESMHTYQSALAYQSMRHTHDFDIFYNCIIFKRRSTTDQMSALVGLRPKIPIWVYFGVWPEGQQGSI
jgi:hypothetical protein